MSNLEYYYNSLTNGMVIDKSLLGEKIKKKKSRRKKTCKYDSNDGNV